VLEVKIADFGSPFVVPASALAAILLADIAPTKIARVADDGDGLDRLRRER
jgi:hypothetical protein